MIPSLLLFGHIFQPNTIQLRIFVNYDCPIARRYTPEFNRIQQDFGKRVDFKIIYCDQNLNLNQLKKHHKEFGLTMPFSNDPKLKQVKKFNVQTVPTAVLTQNDAIAYFGRVDDAYGKDYKWRKPKQFDLRNALSEVLAQKQVKTQRTEPIGCALPKSL